MIQECAFYLPVDFSSFVVAVSVGLNGLRHFRDRKLLRIHTLDIYTCQDA